MDLNALFKKMKQNPIALVMVGLLVLVLMYVLMLGVKTLFNGGSGANNVEISQEEMDDFRNSEISSPQSTQNETRKAKRQKNIRESDITGAWDAQLDNARALLQLKNGTFRLIIVERAAQGTRFYINGTYTLEEDILVFDPDTRSKPPSEKFDYRILTRAKMPMMVGKYKGKMVWQVPPEEANIYVPNYHAILNRVPNNIAVWSTLK